MLRFFKRDREADRKHIDEAVKASRDRWFGRILNVLRSSRLDDSVWEELEEILISSDVGVETSLRIVEELKSTAKEERLLARGVAFPEQNVRQGLAVVLDPLGMRNFSQIE